MVSIDSIAIENVLRDKCREVLKAELSDFDPSMLFINATHTHTCPVQSNHQYPRQAVVGFNRRASRAISSDQRVGR